MAVPAASVMNLLRLMRAPSARGPEHYDMLRQMSSTAIVPANVSVGSIASLRPLGEGSNGLKADSLRLTLCAKAAVSNCNKVPSAEIDLLDHLVGAVK
jgi:hypothetical protein